MMALRINETLQIPMPFRLPALGLSEFRYIGMLPDRSELVKDADESAPVRLDEN